MHASLLPQQIRHLVIPVVVFPVSPEQALEKGKAAIGQLDVPQNRFRHLRYLPCLLYHGRQLLVVAYHHNLPDGRYTVVVGTQDTDEVRLQNLGSLVDDRQREGFHLQEGEVRIHRGRGTDEHPCADDGVPKHVDIVATLHLFAQQVVPVGLATTRLAADSDEVDALFHEFATNLIHGPVGIRHHQHGGTLLQQFLLDRVEHAVGCLARSRRTDDEKEVAGLFHLEGQFVERSVVALERHGFVCLGLPLQE